MAKDNNGLLKLAAVGLIGAWLLESGRAGQLPEFLQTSLNQLVPCTFPMVPGAATGKICPTTGTTPPTTAGTDYCSQARKQLTTLGDGQAATQDCAAIKAHILADSTLFVAPNPIRTWAQS